MSIQNVFNARTNLLLYKTEFTASDEIDAVETTNV
jgi:hypothetical protein